MNPLQRAAQIASKNFTPMRLLPAWRDGQRQYSGWDTTKAIKEGFDQSVWVRACIELRMDAMGSLPWKAYTRPNTNSDWADAPGHPVERLIEYPNAYMDRQELMGLLEAHLCLGGNGFWDTLRLNGDAPPSRQNPPLELWPIDPTGLLYVPSKAEFIRGYRYIKDGLDLEIPAAGVVHFRCANPGDMRWGSSPLKAASRAVDTEIAAQKWNVSIFANRAMPDTVFTFEAPLSMEEWEEARRQLGLNYAGTENARTPWVMGGGATMEVVSWKPIDLDYLEGRKFSRDEILAAFRCPPPMISTMEHSTLANMDASEKQFWNNTIVPRMDKLEAVINRVLVPFFGNRELLKVCYDKSGVEALRDDMGKKAVIYKDLVSNGVPPNVALELAEIEVDAPIAGGDEGYISGLMVPLKDASKLANEPQVTAQPKPRAA